MIFSALKTEGEAYIYTSYILGGAAICAVSYFFCRHYGYDFKEEISFKKAGGVHYIYAALLLFSMIFGLSGLNGYFVAFLEKFGYKYTEITLPEFSAFNYAAVIFTVCIIPAVTEEIAFRGVILSGIKGGGKIGSAIVVGFVFAVYHASPAQTIYQFAVGFLFSLLAFESGSVLPTVIVHFLNNFIIINVYYFCGGNMDFGEIWNIILTVSGVVAAAAFIYIMLKRGEKSKVGFAKKWLILRNFLFYGFLGIIAYVALWILSLLGL